MTLPHLMGFDIIPDDARAEIDGLLKRKQTMGEFGHGDRIAVLDRFIEDQLDWVKNQGYDRLMPSESFAQEANQLLLDALGIG